MAREGDEIMRANIIKMDDLTIEACNCCRNEIIDSILLYVSTEGGYSIAVETDETIIYTISFPSQIREIILEMMEV